MAKLKILERRILDDIADRLAPHDEHDVAFVQLRGSVYQFTPGFEWSLDKAEFGGMVLTSNSCFVGMMPVGSSS